MCSLYIVGKTYTYLEMQYDSLEIFVTHIAMSKLWCRNPIQNPINRDLSFFFSPIRSSFTQMDWVFYLLVFLFLLWFVGSLKVDLRPIFHSFGMYFCVLTLLVPSFFLTRLHGLWDFSSLTTDQTKTFRSESTES